MGKAPYLRVKMVNTAGTLTCCGHLRAGQPGKISPQNTLNWASERTFRVIRLRPFNPSDTGDIGYGGREFESRHILLCLCSVLKVIHFTVHFVHICFLIHRRRCVFPGWSAIHSDVLKLH